MPIPAIDASPLGNAIRGLIKNVMVVYKPNISLPPVLADRKPLQTLIKDYKPRPFNMRLQYYMVDHFF